MSKEILKERAQAIGADLVGFLTEEQIKKATEPGVVGNSLPVEGVFGTYSKSGEGEFKHLRMNVEASTDSVSIANIKLVAPKKGEPIEFDVIKKEGSPLKGKYFLKGKSINPKFAQYSTLELIAYLEGKKFRAVPVDTLSLPYLPTGYTKAMAKSEALVVKGAYQIEIVD